MELNSENMHYNMGIDLAKGILIILVVIGHSLEDYNIIKLSIYLFHMPAFFIISGYLIKKVEFNYIYIKKKIMRLIIPYFFYAGITILFTRKFTLISIAKYIWGGQKVEGVFWFSTCLFVSMIVFQKVLNCWEKSAVQKFLFLLMVLAYIESNMIHRNFLKIGAVPWSLDVVMLSMGYLGSGYYFKDKLDKLWNNKPEKYNKLTFLSIFILGGIIIWNYYVGVDSEYLIEFDMKYLVYHKLVSIFICPYAGTYILLCGARRLSIIEHNIVKKINQILIYFGKNTLPIMYLHIPFNSWADDLGYGSYIYILIGILFPVLVCIFIKKINKPVISLLFGV